MLRKFYRIKAAKLAEDEAWEKMASETRSQPVLNVSACDKTKVVPGLTISNDKMSEDTSEVSVKSNFSDESYITVDREETTVEPESLPSSESKTSIGDLTINKDLNLELLDTHKFKFLSIDANKDEQLPYIAEMMEPAHDNFTIVPDMVSSLEEGDKDSTECSLKVLQPDQYTVIIKFIQMDMNKDEYFESHGIFVENNAIYVNKSLLADK